VHAIQTAARANSSCCRQPNVATSRGKTVDDRLPTRSRQQTLRLLGDKQLDALVERFLSAWEHNDIDGVVSLLAEDARMVMPPLPSWSSGRTQVADFLRSRSRTRVA
jgi:RNA polymerase sigma-70 factor (ECF subfamily)